MNKSKSKTVKNPRKLNFCVNCRHLLIPTQSKLHSDSWRCKPHHEKDYVTGDWKIQECYLLNKGGTCSMYTPRTKKST